ncbi:hypothetical protein GWK47_022444 [Chionoecetes opilio]|uniref:Uncharacterized protein n=1 Tax=Chionoecetes opilio TaxID=41210 RepID=A0A8J4XNJ2_CHIOP|nr:hypothetical protein GWK47_022444 [Chionoecetes opilio]
MAASHWLPRTPRQDVCSGGKRRGAAGRCKATEMRGLQYPGYYQPLPVAPKVCTHISSPCGLLMGAKLSGMARLSSRAHAGCKYVPCRTKNIPEAPKTPQVLHFSQSPCVCVGRGWEAHSSQRGARTHDHEIKSLVLYRLS